MLTCKDCFSKCKGECCTWVPLTVKFIEEHQSKIQREILYCHPHNGNQRVVYPVVKIDGYVNGQPKVNTSEQTCIFLDSNHRCTVYDDRPEICRIFGTTCQPDNTLTCHYHLGKNFSFPKDNTPEKALIDAASMSGKYMSQMMNNEKLIKEIMGL